MFDILTIALFYSPFITVTVLLIALVVLVLVLVWILVRTDNTSTGTRQQTDSTSSLERRGRATHGAFAGPLPDAATDNTLLQLVVIAFLGVLVFSSVMLCLQALLIRSSHWVLRVLSMSLPFIVFFGPCECFAASRLWGPCWTCRGLFEVCSSPCQDVTTISVLPKASGRRRLADISPGCQILRSGAFGSLALTHHGVYVGKCMLDPQGNVAVGDEAYVVDTFGTPGNVKIRKVLATAFCEEGRDRVDNSVSLSSNSASVGWASARDTKVFVIDYGIQEKHQREVIRRALTQVGEPFHYDIVTANCEAYAYWCIHELDESLDDFNGANSEQGYCAAVGCSVLFALLIVASLWASVHTSFGNTISLSVLSISIVCLLFWLRKLFSSCRLKKRKTYDTCIYELVDYPRRGQRYQSIEEGEPNHLEGESGSDGESASVQARGDRRPL